MSLYEIALNFQTIDNKNYINEFLVSELPSSLSNTAVKMLSLNKINS